MTDETSWIEDLEAKVESAVEEILRLRAENAELGRKLAAAESGEDPSSDGQGSSEGQDSSEWQEERHRIRERVEGIVERLEELLGG